MTWHMLALGNCEECETAELLLGGAGETETLAMILIISTSTSVKLSQFLIFTSIEYNGLVSHLKGKSNSEGAALPRIVH